MAFTMQTRMAFRCSILPSLAAALVEGFALGVPFDVSSPSGALVWTWEERATAHPVRTLRKSPKKEATHEST